MKTETVLELLSLIIEKDNKPKKSILSGVIGKYVIVRTRNEGLNCGYIINADETGCVLREARRIYRPISKDRSLSWYEGIAEKGLCPEHGKISGKREKIIIENYSITICSDEAKTDLENFKTNETTYG